MKIVILDQATLGSDIDMGCIEAFGTVVSYLYTTADETVSRLKDADIVITNKVVIDKTVIQNTNLKLICVAATGMNNIDLDFAKKQGILVMNVKGYSTPSVVQTTFAMALHFLGNISYFDHYTKSKNGWAKSPVFTNLERPFHDIEDKTWGIIGLGTIGKKVAYIAESFGANILYYSTSGRNRDSDFQRTTLDDLLSTSDIISIHAPLTHETYNLIGKEQLQIMKEDAILLNLGRGGIINETDLAWYLDNSQIKVGLDVLEKEPIDPNHPLLKIKEPERLLMTPHIAWASVESRERLITGICNNIAKFLGEKR